MKRIIYLFYLNLFLMACQDDRAKISTQDLLGKFEIIEAKRNGEVTRLLSGGYFEFQNDTIMSTNIKGDTIKHLYQLKGHNLSTSGKDPMDFKLRMHSKDTIILKSKIGKSDFEFLTIKSTK